MTKNIIILTNSGRDGQQEIAWENLGTVITAIPRLYQAVKERAVDIILVDKQRLEMNRAVAMKIRRSNGLTDVWKITAHDAIDENQNGFYDGTISVNLGVEGIKKKIKRILADKELLQQYGIIGRSSSMRSLARTINRIAPTDVSVMIVGPSGSGKELVARALHNDSPRTDRPFVAINCGALAEGVLESELFGHERGAFTGSVARREGLFHKAQGGTIFLDEISETKQDMQIKLLRVLEDGTYYPVGSSVPSRTDARVVAATNRDLTKAIADKEFREDLYYRISAVKLVVPPLIDRRGDIQPLLQHFLEEHPGLDYTDSALKRLTQYDWPGNVRQLRNFTSRMLALKPKGLINTDDVEKFLSEQHIAATHLPVSTGRTVEEAGQELIYRAILSLGNEIRMLRNLITSHIPGEMEIAGGEVRPASSQTGSTMEVMEKALIEQVLMETNGNRKEAARKLGIGERTLYRKLNKYDLR